MRKDRRKTQDVYTYDGAEWYPNWIANKVTYADELYWMTKLRLPMFYNNWWRKT